MKIKAKHPGYSAATIRKASRWAAKQIGLDSAGLHALTVEVKIKRGQGWQGWYWHTKKCAPARLVQVLLARGGTYPASAAFNKEEKAKGRSVNDETEIFVMLLVHEMEHARCYHVAKTIADRDRLNSEARVRATDWRGLLEFRQHREALLADWGHVAAEPLPVLPKRIPKWATRDPHLTPSELEILLDRLEGAGGCCIAESITGGDGPVYGSEGDIVERANYLVGVVKELRSIPFGLSALDKQILANCVEASVVLNCTDNVARAVRHLRGLRDKMVAAGVASQIDLPRYFAG